MNKKSFKLCGASEFFELPENRFILKINRKTTGLDDNKIEFESPCVIVSNHMSSLDKSFLSQIIVSPFVFLKQEILEEILLKELPLNKFKAIIKCFNELKRENYSVVIFNDSGISPFGETTLIPIELSDFIMNFKLNIHFINLYGSFFYFPVWADVKRDCLVKFIAKKVLQFEILKHKSNDEVNEEINSCLAFSASDQAYVFNMNIYSMDRAEFAERIVYVCPKCKNLFSIYSEHSCLKCSNCGSAIEFSKNGNISLSKEVRNFRELQENIYNVFKKYDFNTKPLQIYENCLILKQNEKAKPKFEKVKLIIFAHKIILIESVKENKIESNIETVIPIKNLQKIAYIGQNIVKIWQKKQKPIILQGKGKENFYIIFDLIKVNRGETQ